MKAVVIVAGGKGLRMGGDVPKQFLPVGGKPVLMRTIDRFLEYDKNMQVVLVLPAAQQEYWCHLCEEYGFVQPHAIADGGETRFHSVKNGLALVNEGTALIGVHDGVRPLLSVEMVRRGVECAAESGAAVPVIAVVDSIREVDAQGASRAVDRSRLRAVQTPQVFRADLLKEAYEAVGARLEDRSKATDDASVVEMYGHAVALYEGEPQNLKLTTPTDLSVAEMILANGTDL